MTLVIPTMLYLFYFIVAMTAKSNPVNTLSELPYISIIIPAHNEESSIGERIDNLAEVYPVDKMEIIVSNDGSTDRTEAVAWEALGKYNRGVDWRVITYERQGVNVAINRGINSSSYGIIVITGADGLFDKNTIPHLVSVLLSSKDIGAVSGDLIPIAKGESIFSQSEKAYRSIYGKICTWESNLHSTFCFNGPVVAIRKHVISSLNPRKGADDASMALSIIRNGYKCKYVPTAKFYEYVPNKFMKQQNQKIRRATRLLEATFSNIDLLSPKCGKFGVIIFPLRILMFAVVPFMIFIGLILNPFLLATVILFMIFPPWNRVISPFFIYNFYLLVGLFNMVRDVHIWEHTERVEI